MGTSITRTLSVAAVAGAMTFSFALPASASTVSEQDAAPADAAVIEQSQGLEPEEGSLFAEVEDADTEDEQRALLEDAGFTQTTGDDGEERYEQTVDGVTLGWSIGEDEPAADDGTATPMWNVGWSGGPYLAATTSQWQNAAVNAGTIGTAACVFITATLGAFACVAGAGIVTNEISNLDPNAAPADCWEVRGFNPTYVLPSTQC